MPYSKFKVRKKNFVQTDLNNRHLQEQNISSDIEQQPPFGDRKISNTQASKEVVTNQRENHIILTKYEAVHPTDVLENNFSSGMLMI